MKEYGVSLRHPNKRFQMKQTDREERVYEYLKHVWTVCNFFLTIICLTPPTVNGDQMPLHRNRSSTQILNFVDMDAYVKENYNLSCERVTVFTQVSSSSNNNLNAELVFKGKGKLDPPGGIKFKRDPIV